MQIGDIIARAFAARTTAHTLHLSTDKLAVHLALDGFYNDVVSAADALAEQWQGRFGRFSPVILMPVRLDTAEQMIEYLQGEVSAFADRPYPLAAGDTQIINLIDDLRGVYLTAIYKLRFLQ